MSVKEADNIFFLSSLHNLRLFGLSFLSFILTLLICPSISSSAIYFVSQEAAGSGDGSSYGDRASVSSHNAGKGSFSDLAGDVVVLSGRITSSVIVPDSGGLGDEIIYTGKKNYQGAGNPGGKIDLGAGNTGTGSEYDGIRIRGMSHIIIQDLEISNCSNGIMASGGVANITVKRCVIHDTIFKGITFTDGSYGENRNSNVTIGGAPGDGNEIYNCGAGTGGADIQIGWTDNWTVSYNHLYATKDLSTLDARGIDGFFCHDANDGIIEYNRIHSHNDNYSGTSSDYNGDFGARGKGEDGIDIKKSSSKIHIRYNDIYDHTHQSGITVQLGSHDIYIYGNRIWDNGGNIWVYDGSKGCENTRNVFIWSNLILKATRSGISIHQSNCPVNAVSIYNNVIAENGTSPSKLHHSGVRVASGSGHRIKNNIFYKNRPNSTDYVQLYISSSDRISSGSLDYNRYYWPNNTSRTYLDGQNYNSTKVPKQESRGSEGDPVFTDTIGDDYTLDEGSNCKNTGLNLGRDFAVGLDPTLTTWKTVPPVIKSAARTSNGPWDLGAYVYKKGETSLPAPNLKLSSSPQ